MKVIFLDIDGVLNASDYMCALHYRYRSLVHKDEAEYPIPNDEVRDSYGKYFDPRCIIHLEAIINFTGCKIVISSTWRKDGLTKMKNLWEYRDLPGEIVGVTPVLNMERGEEIKNYLEEHDYITDYCIIDDDSDMLPEQMNNFVKTSNKFGLTHQDAERVINILNGE